MKRVKTYFDHETRKVIRASNKILRLCRFKQDNDILAEGLRTILKELNGETPVSKCAHNEGSGLHEPYMDSADSIPFNQKGDMYEKNRKY